MQLETLYNGALQLASSAYNEDAHPTGPSVYMEAVGTIGVRSTVLGASMIVLPLRSLRRQSWSCGKGGSDGGSPLGRRQSDARSPFPESLASDDVGPV